MHHKLIWKNTALFAALGVGLAACGANSPSSTMQPSTTPVATSEGGAADASVQTAEAVTPQGVVAAFETNFGVHPGQRRNHSKGVCATGEFIADPAAQAWSRSALFSGDAVPVVVRFSLPGGNPEAADASPSPRGMALEFQLPDGQRQHMTMLNVPIFSAATPQSFYEGLLAASPNPTTGKPDPARLQHYRETHPDTAPQAEYMKTYRPPASFATTRYFSIHAFTFINAKNEASSVKWRFEPEDGEQVLDQTQAEKAPRDFLADTLIARLKKGPVRWQMHVTLGQPQDPTDNPTLAWPEDRKTIVAGTLDVLAAGAQAGDACVGINFDPMVMADGIKPSNDPVLAFRSPAYAASFAKRLAGQ